MLQRRESHIRKLQQEIAGYKQYKGAKYSYTISQNIEKHTETISMTLVHEMIHYRFKSLEHGAEYEKRIPDILRGKVWPQTCYSIRIHHNRMIKTLHQHPQ